MHREQISSVPPARHNRKVVTVRKASAELRGTIPSADDRDTAAEETATTVITVTEENRFSAGEQIQQPLYGSEVKTAMRRLPEEYATAVPDILTNFCFGDFYTRKGLNLRQRELLSLVVLTATGAEKQLKAHIIGNIKAGNDKSTLLAAMVQLVPYIGLPGAMTAINLIKNAEIDTYQPIYGEQS